MRIRLDQITKSFKTTTAVDNISFTIEDGEMICLLGPSGCGKSTTLSMVAGLEQPTSGEIYFDDRPMSGVEAEDRDIGMVFQNYALYPHMSVQDNIMFPLKMRHVPKAERISRMKQVAEMLQISDLLHRKPGQLSGGQQQRYDHLIGFGDSWNDVPLFRACDEGYAVANASENLKQISTDVILSNAEDGVAVHILQHHKF